MSNLREDFDGTTFAVGSMVGIRSFHVEEDGVLTGVTYRMGRWSAGQNIGECYRYMTGDARNNHRAGTRTCHCGWHAYFDLASNSYHYNGNVLGIVEGYGLMSVGVRGFRCEKARILALIDEPEPKWWRRPLRPNVSKNLSRLPVGVFARYPAVPIFTSIWRATAAFPLTTPRDAQWAMLGQGRAA